MEPLSCGRLVSWCLEKEPNLKLLKVTATEATRLNLECSSRSLEGIDGETVDVYCHLQRLDSGKGRVRSCPVATSHAQEICRFIR